MLDAGVRVNSSGAVISSDFSVGISYRVVAAT